METKYYLIAIVFLLLVNILQFFNNQYLEKRYNSYVIESVSKIQNLEKEKRELETQLSESIQKFTELTMQYRDLNYSYNSLKKENYELNQSYNSITNEYDLLSRNYSSLKVEAENLVKKLDQYAEKINESMSWFSKNSNIIYMDNSLKTTLANDLEYDCYRSTSSTCSIKTACFMLVNDEFYGLKYITDTSLYGKSDKLASLDDFVSNRGGDCEDYSMFFKAEINKILQECKGKQITIESYVPSNTQDKYFINYRSNWYIENMEAKNLQTGNIYPVVVCYLNEPQLGHCVVAFSKYSIKTSSDINKLDGAELIEPQDGSYVGRIGKEIALPVVPNRINELMIVITDDDLYSFDEDGWTGYKDFMKEIDGMKTELIQYIN